MYLTMQRCPGEQYSATTHYMHVEMICSIHNIPLLSCVLLKFDVPIILQYSYYVNRKNKIFHRLFSIYLPNKESDILQQAQISDFSDFQKYVNHK